MIESPKPPVFILCCSRSGSTLLRYILDTHPAVGCPPELHLGYLIERLEWSQTLAEGHDLYAGSNPNVLKQVRGIVDTMMDGYLARVGKTVWCDKSVSTIDLIEKVQRVYPDARFICLYRNCMDMVYSGLEVSRYGFKGYGFEEFVAAHLENTVAGIIDYWCDKTGKILAFEERNPNNTYRVRYEDVVFRSNGVITGLFNFLDLSWDADLMDRIFKQPHQDGPGDANIVFTSRIEKASVGNGGKISFDQIPDVQLTRMNQLLARLDYACVESDWDTRPSPYIPEGAQDAATPKPKQAETAGGAGPGDALNELSKMVKNQELSAKIKFVFDDLAGESWMFVLDQGKVAIGPGDETADCDIFLESSALNEIVAGTANPMKLLRSGKLRPSKNMGVAWQLFMG